MSRALIIVHQRLGDIVGSLPAARHLAQLGHETDFCCFSRYHSIFRAVSYCRPIAPETVRRDDYDHVYNLEITRREYDAYRASSKRWREYVYGKNPDLIPALHEPPVFDRLPNIANYNLPPAFALAAPFGISQVTRVNGNWFRQQCEAVSSGPWYVLTERPTQRIAWAIPLHARSLDHLPALIASAATFVTINSAPNIIASGVRTSWHQVEEPGFGGQDNYDAPGQIALRQPAEISRHSWRFWIHYWRRKLMGVDVSQDKGTV